MLIKLIAVAAVLPLIAAAVSAAPSRPFAAVPFSAGAWWAKAPSIPLTLADGSMLGRLSLAWDAESVYAHLSDAAEAGTLTLQFTGATRKIAWKDGALDISRTWKSLGMPPGQRNALIPINVGFAAPRGADTWIPKDPLGLNTLTWGIMVLDASSAPHRLRSDVDPPVPVPVRSYRRTSGAHLRAGADGRIVPSR